MDDQQLQRVARNEARFRAANERLSKAQEEFHTKGSSYDVICECALLDCDGMFNMSREAYTQLRSNDRWFAVLPDHVVEEAEFVQARNEHYWVVEKRPNAILH